MKKGSIGPLSPISTSTAGLAARATAGSRCSALSRCATAGPAGMLSTRLPMFSSASIVSMISPMRPGLRTPMVV